MPWEEHIFGDFAGSTIDSATLEALYEGMFNKAFYHGRAQEVADNEVDTFWRAGLLPRLSALWGEIIIEGDDTWSNCDSRENRTSYTRSLIVLPQVG